MYCRNCRAPESERGVALVVALLVFAICAALLVGLQRDFLRAYQRGSNLFLAEQSWAYLRGAEDLAGLLLTLDFDADSRRELRRDDLTEIWAQEATPYALDEGGWMAGDLADLQGRFNLNSLANQLPASPGAERFTPAQQFFIRMLQALGELVVTEYEAVAITEAIGDWMDVDDNPRLNGTESAYYSALTPAYRPANRAMATVSELRAVANVTPELYRALEPLVTVWPRTPSPINIHTAPATLLRAMNVDGNLSPLSERDGETLALRRLETGYVDLEDFLAQPEFVDGPREGLASLLGESSSYFLLSARVEIADREQRLYSVLRREAQQVSVLQRLRGAL